jgi:iron complex outermembrane recepter protein
MRRTILLATAAVAALSSPSAFAQTQPGQGTDEVGLDEIIVTARKVEERLQDVPLSIRAFSGDTLAAAGVSNITDLANATPGLQYATDLGRTAERPVVRGISSLRPEAPQPVSVFLDGVYVRDGVLALLMDDVARVEVIKGPQSSLYGRATYMGAINVVSKRPTDTFTAKMIGTVAEAEQYEFFGVISGPIIDNKLSGRFAVKSYEFGGQYTNGASPTGAKLGKERTFQMQAGLEFKPSENFTAYLTGSIKKDRDGYLLGVARTVPTISGTTITSLNGTTNVADLSVCDGKTLRITVNNTVTGQPDPSVAVPAATRLNGWPCGAVNGWADRTTVFRNVVDLQSYIDPRTGRDYGNIEGLNQETHRAALTLTWDVFDGHTITSQTGYSRQAQKLGTDQSYNNTRFAVTNAPWTTFDDNTLSTWSQELKVSSPTDQRLQWLAGGFYYTEYFQGITTNVIQRASPTAPVTAAPTRLVSPRETLNWALFGRLQYEIFEGLRASAEVRYSYEKNKFGDNTSLGTAVITTDRFTAGQPVIVNVPVTDKGWSPRFTLDYKVLPDVLLYAQVAKGTKSGGINAAAGTPASQVNFRGETVWAYEFGAKTEWFDRRVRANVALFQNDVNELQLSQAVVSNNPVTGLPATITVVSNVGKARTRGVEFELDVAVTSTIRAGVTYAYTDAKAVQGFEITSGNAFGGNQSVAGFKLPRSPEHSLSGNIGYTQPLAFWDDTKFFFRVDANYQSRRYAEVQNLIWADPTTKVNLNTGLDGGRWKATLWVKNLFNSDEAANAFRYLDPLTFRRSAVDWLPRLRQIGGTVTFDF